jgi:hypothetical protein
MRVWLKHYALWIFGGALLLAFDLGLSSLATCVSSQQQQADQCAEKYYGFADAISVRIPAWFLGEIREETTLINAAATVVIAIFTITLWVSTHRMWKGSTEQLRHAEKTAEQQLRAYVMTKSFAFEDDGLSGPEIAVTVENVGETPAIRVRAHLNWQWYPDPNAVLPADFAYPDYNSEKGGSIINLGRGIPSVFKFPIEREKYEAARRGQIALFIYGHVDYADIFKNLQSTEFCFRMETKIVGTKCVSRMIAWGDHNT